MLLDCISVNRRQQTQDTYGQVVMQSHIFSDIDAIVFPEGPEDLARRPEAQTMTKSLTIITEFPLQGPAEVIGTEYQPDVILWNDDNYVLVKLEDWSRYADGFVKATCESYDLIDSPPGDPV